MARGNKPKGPRQPPTKNYTEKQYIKRTISKKEAQRQTFASVNKTTGGAKKLPK